MNKIRSIKVVQLCATLLMMLSCQDRNQNSNKPRTQIITAEASQTQEEPDNRTEDEDADSGHEHEGEIKTEDAEPQETQKEQTSDTAADDACLQTASDVEYDPPATIEDAVALINQLPKPVSIPCFLRALPQPYKLLATSSDLSAQPAASPSSPRYFLFMDELIISVVPDGEGKGLVEFSYLLSNAESIKGELAFPVVDELPDNSAYLKIMSTIEGVSRCSGCHLNERLVEDESFAPGAYASKAIRPFDDQVLTRLELNAIAAFCAGKTTDQCLLTNELLQGEYELFSFPKSMPEFF